MRHTLYRFLLITLTVAAFLPSARARDLESTRTRLEEEVATLDTARDEAVATLRRQYIAGLERRMETLSGEDLRVLSEERDRAAADSNPLRPGPLSDHPGVRHYQDILLKQLDQIERPRAERLAVLVKNLQRFAEDQVAQLRAGGQIPAADEWGKWAGTLSREYLDPRFGAGGKTRFFTLLESGRKPYLMIVGNSTSGFPDARIDAPWKQCKPGSRAPWPGTLSQRLRELGELRLGGATCAGANSRDFIKGKGAGDFVPYPMDQLEWVANEKPDAVILEFAVGIDCADRFNMSVAESRANIETIIRTLRAKNPNMDIFLWNAAKSFDQGHRDFGSDRDGTKREVSKEPQEAYAQMCIDFAGEAGPGTYYMDTFSTFAEILKDKGMSTYRTYFRDGNHTNLRGGEEVIVPEMLEVLEFGNP